jgi:hypothetical protein
MWRLRVLFSLNSTYWLVLTLRLFFVVSAHVGGGGGGVVVGGGGGVVVGGGSGGAEVGVDIVNNVVFFMLRFVF